MTSECSQAELAATLDAVVAEVLAASGVDSPPVNAVGVASSLGMPVAFDDRQSGRARFVRLRPRGELHQESILVRPDSRTERLQWAIAHEIGESRVEQVFRRLAVNPHEVGDATRERCANQLANRLLLPSEWFHRDALKCDWDLLALKKRYVTVSHEMIARRMLDCSPSVIITVIDNGRLTRRQSNVSGRIPQLSPIERDCWQSASITMTPHAKGDATFSVQAWPVHEPLWRREILRTELRTVD